MQIVHVFIEVKPEDAEAFRQATVANANASRQEPGIARFDFFQEEGNAGKFLLIEIYSDPEAPARHKQTAHYSEWRAAVDHLMAVPRYSIRYVDLLPAA